MHLEIKLFLCPFQPVLVVFFTVAASREPNTSKRIIDESFDADVDWKAFKPPIVKFESLYNSLIKASAKRLGSFFVQLDHSDLLSEVAQKYAQFRQE